MNMDASSENHSLQKYYFIGQEKVKAYMVDCNSFYSGT